MLEGLYPGHVLEEYPGERPDLRNITKSEEKTGVSLVIPTSLSYILCERNTCCTK
ncbi:hypothetical protein HS1genome_1449 [Sulfodiicoccus acidiphilus]|uniref:Uncharacterized protein n=1 Tax=Sulfodiicoccus acidiphilus TaxID=1670455 RepID=A0A348B4F8_9CREN|nr:hypothetical protein HS1genome_1449 [Sulfodiicoccus acidiphilus]